MFCNQYRQSSERLRAECRKCVQAPNLDSIISQLTCMVDKLMNTDSPEIVGTDMGVMRGSEPR